MLNVATQLKLKAGSTICRTSHPLPVGKLGIFTEDLGLFTGNLKVLSIDSDGFATIRNQPGSWHAIPKSLLTGQFFSVVKVKEELNNTTAFFLSEGRAR